MHMLSKEQTVPLVVDLPDGLELYSVAGQTIFPVYEYQCPTTRSLVFVVPSNPQFYREMGGLMLGKPTIGQQFALFSPNPLKPELMYASVEANGDVKEAISRAVNALKEFHS